MKILCVQINTFILFIFDRLKNVIICSSLIIYVEYCMREFDKKKILSNCNTHK